MTQPSLHSTFDTSLIDLGPDNAIGETTKDSFSTTESMPSEKSASNVAGGDDSDETGLAPGSDGAPKPASINSGLFREASTTTTKDKIPVRYLPTVSAYNQWASVYDVDGNVLQAVDDMELESLLPTFFDSIEHRRSGEPIRIVDFGCGTGRNTLKLLKHGSSRRYFVTGIDASEGMLSQADQKLSEYSMSTSQDKTGKPTYQLIEHDFLDPLNPSGDPILLEPLQTFDALVTTLVLEHLPLKPFFDILRSLVSPGGTVLLTNMHPDMGSVSQAGFVGTDEKGNQIKVRGTSWVHGVQDTMSAATAAGFELLSDLRERKVTEEITEQLGPRSKKWIGIKLWYGMILKRKESIEI